MIKILLVCSGGMSTSMLATRMREEAEKKGIETTIWAVAETKAEEEAKNADIILLGPQLRFKKDELERKIPDKPIVPIEMRDYGTMNGKAVLELVLAQVNV